MKLSTATIRRIAIATARNVDVSAGMVHNVKTIEHGIREALAKRKKRKK